MPKELKCSHRLFKSGDNMPKERKCSHRLFKSGDNMPKNVSVLTGYLNLVIICQRDVSVLTDY